MRFIYIISAYKTYILLPCMPSSRLFYWELFLYVWKKLSGFSQSPKITYVSVDAGRGGWYRYLLEHWWVCGVLFASNRRLQNIKLVIFLLKILAIPLCDWHRGNAGLPPDPFPTVVTWLLHPSLVSLTRSYNSEPDHRTHMRSCDQGFPKFPTPIIILMTTCTLSLSASENPSYVDPRPGSDHYDGFSLW